jgi:tRNA 2-thiouridine synthesizing protein A
MRRLDATGLKCPLPVLKARKLLLGMRAGELLELTTTDAMSVVDIPVFCAQNGHIMISECRRDEGFVFVIEKGPK